MANEHNNNINFRVVSDQEANRPDFIDAGYTAEEETDKTEFIRNANISRELRDMEFSGTSPEVIWGQEANESCRTFLHEMEKSGYEGAYTLVGNRRIRESEEFKKGLFRKPEVQHTWSDFEAGRTSGYPIAVAGIRWSDVYPQQLAKDDYGYQIMPNGKIRYVDSILGNKPNARNVFLCADGLLRFANIRQNLDFNAVSHQWEWSEIPDEIYDVTDLPLDRNGHVDKPVPGKIIIPDSIRDIKAGDGHTRTHHEVYRPLYILEVIPLLDVLVELAVKHAV